MFLHQFMTLFVHQQFALYALETLSAQSPDAILAIGTEGALKESKERSALETVVNVYRNGNLIKLFIKFYVFLNCIKMLMGFCDILNQT